MTNILSPEEREEYDALLRDAAYEKGRLVQSDLVASRAHALLIDAVKAGRSWAEIQLERALMDGIRGEVRRYVKRVNTTTETDALGSRSRPKVYSVPQENADGGVHWQPKLFEDMTLTDLDQVIKSSGAQIAANLHNKQAAIRLRDKIIATKAATVRDALAALGESLEEALAV